MIERIKARLANDWTTHFPNRSKPSSMRFLLTRGSYGRHARATVLLFAGDERQPFCVVKIPCFDDGSELVQTEHDNLQRLHAMERPIPGLAAPRCWLMKGLDPRPVLVQHALTGKPLRKVMWKERRSDLLCLGVEAISRLHQASRVDHRFSKEDYVRYVGGPINAALQDERYRANKESLERMALRLERLIDEQIPLVLCHRDVRVSNLRIEGETFQLYDWEFSRWPGLPIVDVVDLIVDYRATERVIDFATSFARLNDHVGGDVDMDIGSLLERYCAQMRLNNALIPIWLDLFVVQKLHLARQIVFPLQVLDGIDWAKQMDRLIEVRAAAKEVV